MNWMIFLDDVMKSCWQESFGMNPCENQLSSMEVQHGAVWLVKIEISPKQWLIVQSMWCTLPANLVVINKGLHYKQSNQSMALNWSDYFRLLPRNFSLPYMGIHGNTFGNTCTWEYMYSQGLWEYMGLHWEYTCRNSLQVYIGLYKGV